jgi:hypothetical protein
MRTKVILLCSLFLLVSCNPFAKNSLVNIIDLNPSLLEPTTFDLNNGGKASITLPASGLSSDAHSVRLKVGRSFSQNQRVTGDGHSIEVSLKGRR